MMAATMADTRYITSNAKLPPKALARDVDITQPLLHVDEDDSSLSSVGSTDLFDRETIDPNQQTRWQLDHNGKWRRYGSSESAASTGISSMCSSVGVDEPAFESIIPPTASRKRMLDGTVKPNLPNLDHNATSLPTINAEQLEVAHPHPQPQPPQKIPKKRGRPRKYPRPEDLALGTASVQASQAPAAESTSSKPPRISKTSKAEVKARPRSSIPSRLPAEEFATQCIDAAHDSRLDPYALHPGEHKLLADALMSKEVTVYLNIRNAILRLWKQNTLCSVSAVEAAGCAKESRFFGLAEVAYRWLTRNGYINFGCVEVPKDPSVPKRFSREARQRTVVVIGAGVAGLTTARQLENLFRQEAARWLDMGERPPRVIVLEGRKRVGGRVYSKPLRSQVKGSLPDGLRNTAEMGAMIVTGFDHGNPLDTIIRGQLGLRYHLMKDALTIYDCDGTPIEEERDMLNTELYTDISDRAGEYRAEAQKPDTLRGNEDLINRCRDPAPDGFAAFQLAPLPTAHLKEHKPAARRGRRRNAPPGTEKLTGRSQITEESNATHSASRAARNMGWQLREGVARNQSISLQKAAGASRYPTLGTVMDEAILQYQDLINLTSLDMRLLNWHHANLEYANAAPVSQLSLSGHDQDTGNEFEGAHSEVIGGYTQVPRGLMNLPTKLDVRFERIVESIHYDNGNEDNKPLSTKVVCTNGEVIDADEVIITAPLGVLKSDAIDFDPPLPHWKQGAIDRMGFGLLNKVVLLYDSPFWDDERDMFGLLNEAEQAGSLDPSEYERRRGRFYLIWNASKISGRPMLVALMAGNAAHDAEWTDTTTLMNEVTARLRTTFRKSRIPAPLEVIVTRWRRDPFTRGTYSYVGPETRPGDYDLMAKSVGNLHFAGEATCGTHPATVHGAMLSGLRVASEVIDDMAGLITLPNPLVGPATIKQEAEARYEYLPAQPSIVQHESAAPAHVDNTDTISVAQTKTLYAEDHSATPFIKQEEGTHSHIPNNVQPALNVLSSLPPPMCRKPSGPPAKSVCAKDPSFWLKPSSDGTDLDYEASVYAAILSQIGERPVKPDRPGVNPFLLYTKAKWEECRAYCAKEFPTNASKNIIRQTIGKWWKAADDATKQPYLVQSQTAQELADQVRRDYETKVVQWDKDAARIRAEYAAEHPPPEGMMRDGNGVSKRKTNVSNCVVLDHS